MRTSGWVGALAVAAALSIAGCGSAVVGPAAPGSTAASTPARSASSSSTPAPPPTQAGPTAASQGTTPPGGPVPAGFAATSVTFVSPDEAFVLGTAPCAQAPCTSVVRTLDRGASWAAVPAPAEPVGQAGLASGPVVWGIRFATAQHGFVFGDGLWETTDGARQWTRAATPPGYWVLSLAIVHSQVLAVMARCTAGGCPQSGMLVRRPLIGGPWSAVASSAGLSLIDPDDLIATQAGIAAVIADNDVLVTADGGVTFSRNPIPCPLHAGAPSVAVTGTAVTGTTGLALLCTGEGYTGHTIKQVYVSDDAGAHWTLAGAPSPDGDGGTIAATTTGRLAIATASAASWLFYSGNAGTSWQTVNEQYDGGSGWADLGFTTAADGVVVHGPADSDGNRTQRPGQLFRTEDAGATWSRVSF
jgi:photosystem II stability/assembly factor-like uncharacterized protein